MIVITTSGIKSKASERIMSPAVACLVVRATPQSSQTGTSLIAPLAAVAPLARTFCN
jgi:hypothetical protein